MAKQAVPSRRLAPARVAPRAGLAPAAPKGRGGPVKPPGGVTPAEAERPVVFPFQFQIGQDLNKPIPVGVDAAVLHCAVRHTLATEINLRPSSTAGELNLGARLYSEDKQLRVYETRLFSQPRTLQPRAWTPVTITIPRDIVKLGIPYVLNVDFVREHEYWFSNKGGGDYEHLVSFADQQSGTAGPDRFSAIEKELAAMRANIESFQSHVPKLLNAISAANAAASIVGKAKSAIDAEEGPIGKALQKLSYEVGSLWQAYDAIAKRLDASAADGAPAGAPKGGHRRGGRR